MLLWLCWELPDFTRSPGSLVYLHTVQEEQEYKEQTSSQETSTRYKHKGKSRC